MMMRLVTDIDELGVVSRIRVEQRGLEDYDLTLRFGARGATLDTEQRKGSAFEIPLGDFAFTWQKEPRIVRDRFGVARTKQVGNYRIEYRVQVPRDLRWKRNEDNRLLWLLDREQYMRHGLASLHWMRDGEELRRLQREYADAATHLRDVYERTVRGWHRPMMMADYTATGQIQWTENGNASETATWAAGDVVVFGFATFPGGTFGSTVDGEAHDDLFAAVDTADDDDTAVITVHADPTTGSSVTCATSGGPDTNCGCAFAVTGADAAELASTGFPDTGGSDAEDPVVALDTAEGDEAIAVYGCFDFDAGPGENIVAPHTGDTEIFEDGLGASDWQQGYVAHEKATGASTSVGAVADPIDGAFQILAAAVIPTTAAGAALTAVRGEAQQLSEAPHRNLGLTRLRNESASLDDDTLRALGLVRVLDEDADLQEETPRVLGIRRLRSATLELEETHSGHLGLRRVRDATLDLPEDSARTVGLMRLHDVSLSLVEAVARSLGLVRDQAATIALEEFVLSARGLVRTRSEVEELSETTLSTRGLVRLRAAAMELAETVAAVRGVIRAHGVTLELVADMLSVRGLTRARSTAMELPEAHAAVRGLTRDRNTTVALAEDTGSVRGLRRAQDDTAQLAETTLAARGLVRLHVVTLQLAELVLRRMGLVRIRDGSMQLTADTHRVLGLRRIREAALALGEAVVSARGMIRQHDETSALEEQHVARTGLVRVIAETVQLVETVASNFAVVFLGFLVHLLRMVPVLDVDVTLEGVLDLQASLDATIATDIDLRPSEDS